MTGQRIGTKHSLELFIQIRKIVPDDVRRSGNRVLSNECLRLGRHRDHGERLPREQVVRHDARDVRHHGIGVVDAVEDAAVLLGRRAPKMRLPGLATISLQQRADPSDGGYVLRKVVAEPVWSEDHRRAARQQRRHDPLPDRQRGEHGFLDVTPPGRRVQHRRLRDVGNRSRALLDVLDLWPANDGELFGRNPHPMRGVAASGSRTCGKDLVIHRVRRVVRRRLV